MKHLFKRLCRQAKNLRQYIIMGAFFSFRYTPRPWQIYTIDPALIKQTIDFPEVLEADKILGRVGFSYGSWDKASIPLKEDFRYKSLVAHFKHNIDWNKTEYFAKLIRGEVKKSKWNIFGEPEEILYSYDLLYNHAKLNPQLVYNKKNPILVYIDRDGNMAVRDGNHRIIIAQLLGIKKVYIKILGRHGKWIEKRHELLNNEDSSLGLSHFRKNPDISSYV